MTRCPDGEYFDAINDERCMPCLDICEALPWQLDFCILECPKYYREHIQRLAVESTVVTHPSAATDQIPSLQYRLVSQPHFWTSVVSLLLTFGCTIVILLLCLSKRSRRAPPVRSRGLRGSLSAAPPDAENYFIDDDDNSSSTNINEYDHEHIQGQVEQSTVVIHHAVCSRPLPGIPSAAVAEAGERELRHDVDDNGYDKLNSVIIVSGGDNNGQQLTTSQTASFSSSNTRGSSNEDIIDLRSTSLIPDFSCASEMPTRGSSDKRKMPRGHQQQSRLCSRLHVRHSAYTQAVQESSAERRRHIDSVAEQDCASPSGQYSGEEQTIPKLVSPEQQLLSLRETNLSFLTG